MGNKKYFMSINVMDYGFKEYEKGRCSGPAQPKSIALRRKSYTLQTSQIKGDSSPPMVKTPKASISSRPMQESL